MALKNRSEVSVAIQAQAAVVGETEYKQGLDDDFAQSVVFRKDVSSATTATATTKSLDFDDIDYIEVTQSNNVAYTLNNILQGEIKFLKITKSAAQTITFANGTDVSSRKAFINSTTVVIYKITNKDGDLYVESINIDNEVTEPKIIEIGDWDMDATALLGVAHGLVDYKKIRSISVIIRDDSDIVYYPLNYIDDLVPLSGGISIIGTTNITLNRITGAKFDSVTFNSTSYNRGWITINYVP